MLGSFLEAFFVIVVVPFSAISVILTFWAHGMQESLSHTSHRNEVGHWIRCSQKPQVYLGVSSSSLMVRWRKRFYGSKYAGFWFS